MKKINLSIIVFALILLSSVSAFSDESKLKASLISSVTTSIYSNVNDVNYKDHKMQIRPKKGGLFAKKKIIFRQFFSKNKDEKKLVFVMSGLGGLVQGDLSKFLASKLHEEGYTVIVLPNSLQSRFSYAASSHGYPGNIVQDARDMYYGMLRILDYLKEDQGFSPESIQLLGYSMGALCGAHIAKIDAEDNLIGIDRTVLVNVPVDLTYGMKILDSFKAESDNISLLRKMSVGLKALHEIEEAHKHYLNPEIIKSFKASMSSLSVPELKMLIGRSLSKNLGPLVRATQDIYDLGVLPDVNDRTTKSRKSVAKKFTFVRYAEEILIPFLQLYHDDKTLNFKQLSEWSSLPALEDFLMNSTKVNLMHSSDDFLLREGDVDYLKSVFKDRAKIYSTGGHLGHISEPESLQQIMKWLGN